MQIRLQTTVTPFYDSFVEFLPVVEKAMIDHGLDPRDFIIAKDRTQFNSFPGLRQRFHNYTVSVKGKDFTVMQPTDLSFLKYFYDRCIAPEQAAPHMPFWVTCPLLRDDPISRLATTFIESRWCKILRARSHGY